MVEFCPGVNAIIGGTDQGKSGLIRGLRWAMRNKAGSGFWNTAAEKNGDPCLVGLAIEDEGKEKRIVRKRTKNTNFYVVIDDETRQEFTAFGRDLPEPVKKLLGEPVIFGKDLVYDLNISPQVEMPFLLSENPRNFTRVLGKLTGIDVLDTAEGLMAARGRELGSKSRTLREERDQVQSSLEALPDPEVITRLLDQAEEIAKKATSNDKRANDLSDMVAKLERNEQRLETAHEVLQRVSLRLEPIETGYTELMKSMSRLRSLISLRDSAVDLDNRLQEARSKTRMLPVAPSAAIDALESATRRLMALEALIESASKISVKIETKIGELEETDDELATERARLSEMLAKIEICPLSGGQLFDECRELLKP